MKTASAVLFSGLLLVGLLLSGCSGSKEMQREAGLVWPAPPDTARVEYIGTHTGEKDYPAMLGGVLKALGGESQGLQLDRPIDVCVDAGGKIFVTDATVGVVVFDTANRKVYRLDEKSPIPLGQAKGIGYGHGKVFIGLGDLGQIAVFGPNDSLIHTIGRRGMFPHPIDVVCDTPRSRILIVDNSWHKVFVYTENGDSVTALGERGEADGEFNYPQAVAVDTAGNIYVVDAFNFRVEVFDVNGKYQRKFGRQGDAAATFERMKGIALDSFGHIYVLDGGHQNFQIFSNEGKLLLAVGTLSERNDGFQNPVSIFIDRRNDLYVTDQLNARVQVFHLIKGE